MNRTWGSAAATAIVTLSAGVCGAQTPEVPAVLKPAATVWNFLGVPQGYQAVKGAVTNRRGNLPGTEPHPPLRALTAPENFVSPNLAIRQAAAIKLEEDLAPQKIKAVKYLAATACGCYDADGSVTDALIASAESCSERVRLATVEAITESASGKCCGECGQVCCCNEKLTAKLAQIAYERDDQGCYLEPSAPVRQAAEAALRACCASQPPAVQLAADAPAPPAGENGPALPPAVPLPELPLPEASRSSGSPYSLVSAQYGTPGAPAAAEDELARMQRRLSVSPMMPDLTPNPDGAVVKAYDAVNAVVYVETGVAEAVLEPGTLMQLRSDPRFGESSKGLWQVVQSAAGCANLQPVVVDGAHQVRIGDHANPTAADPQTASAVAQPLLR